MVLTTHRDNYRIPHNPVPQSSEFTLLLRSRSYTFSSKCAAVANLWSENTNNIASVTVSAPPSDTPSIPGCRSRLALVRNRQQQFRSCKSIKPTHLQLKRKILLIRQSRNSGHWANWNLSGDLLLVTTEDHGGTENKGPARSPSGMASPTVRSFMCHWWQISLLSERLLQGESTTA